MNLVTALGNKIYRRPSGARYLVGSTMAPMLKSGYPVHFVAMDVKSTRTIVDQVLSVRKCVRLPIMSEKSYDLLFKVFATAPERTKDNLYQYLKRSSWDVLVDDSDKISPVMMEVEPLLEASGKGNWRSITLTHDEFPCHCLLQKW